jgi:hypothetical protein
MGAIRSTTVVILLLIGAGVSAQECVTGARLLSTSASNPNLIAGPVAWSGTVLAVGKTQEGVLGAAWVAVYGEGMETVSEDRFLVNDARSLISMVWTGSEFGLFYRTLTQGLNLQRLTMNGTPIGTPIAITASRPVFAGDVVEAEWSPVHDAYVVAHNVSQSSLRGLYLTMLEANGTQRSDRPIFVSVAQQSPLALAITDSGAIGVFFITANDLLGLAIVRGSDDTPVVREVGSGGSGGLVADARGELFVVAKTAFVSGETGWLIVDTVHQISKFEALLVKGSGEDALPQALVATDTEIALSYIDSPIRTTTLDDTFRLRRFTTGGTLIGDTPFAPTDLSAVRAVTSFPFVWTGRSYIAAPVRESPDRINSHLIRYCPLRASIVAPRKVLVRETVTFTPAPDGGIAPYSYEWSFSNSAFVERGSGVTSVQRTFTQAGTYTATLVTIDGNGIRTTTTFTFDVGYARRRAARH